MWQKLTFGGCLVALIAFGLVRFQQGASALAFFPLLVLLPLGAFAFRGAWDKDPVLTLDSTGIWFKTWRRDDPLPWSQIQKIELLTVGPGDPFVGFFLMGEEPYKLPSNSIRVSHLNVRTKVFYEFCLDYWHRFGPNSSLHWKAAQPVEL
jgi:hypothetical protein